MADAHLLHFGSSTERVETLRKSVEQAKESLRIEHQKCELGKALSLTFSMPSVLCSMPQATTARWPTSMSPVRRSFWQ